MLGLKGELHDLLIKHNWKLKSNKGLVMIFEQDEREIQIKLTFKKIK